MATDQAQPKLELYLLGAPQVHLAGKSLTDLPIKTQALLFYLAVTRQSHPRAALATLLWGESAEKNARASLRKTVQQLRQTLPDHLMLAEQSVALRTDVTVWVDAVHFSEQIARGKKSGDSGALAKAIPLYRGDFLRDFLAPKAPDFERWQTLQQLRLREQMVDALQTLSRHWIAQEHLTNAIAITRRMIALEPWREEAHRQLMELLARNNERGAALAHFDLCREQLRRELDVEPSAATLELVTKLRTDTFPHAKANHAARLPSKRTDRPNPLNQVTTGVEFPLMGREREWRMVETLWHSLHRPHFLCIGGEAGMGKTRLAEELLLCAEQEGAAVARTRSHALQGQLAYGPITDWLRSAPLQAAVQQIEDVWLTELVRLLPELLIDRPTLAPPEPLRESWQRKRFLDALLRAFVAVKGNLLLVLDDLQWTDGETLEWLQYLVESGQTRLLVVGTVRTDEINAKSPLHRVRQQLERHDRFTELLLAPLSPTATTALAIQVSEQHLPAKAAQQLFQETAGNPLFVIESMRADPETAAVTTLSPHPEHNAGQEQRFVPAKIYSVIQTRLAQLSPTAQALVQLGATIGRSFDVALLAQAAGLDDDMVLTGLDELWQRRVIYEVDAVRFDFSHDRIRDVAYSEISPLKRRLLHRNVADALEAIHRDELDAVCGHLALHCEAAGRLTKAADYYYQAADAARKLFAHREATHKREQALRLLRELPSSSDSKQKEIDFLLALSNDRTMAYGKGHPSVHEPLLLAHKLVQDHGSTVQYITVLDALTVYERVRGQWRTALQLAAKSLTAAKETNDPSLLRCPQYGIASSSMRLGDLETAHRLFAQLTRDAFATSVAKHPLGSQTNFSHCLWLYGYPEQAQQQAVISLRLVQFEQDPAALPMALHHSALVYVYCHDLSTVDKLSAELVEVTTNRNDEFALRWGQIYRGWLLVQQGERHEGIELIRENADEHRRQGNYFYESLWRSLLAEAYIEVANLDAAHDEIDDAFAYAEASGDCHWNAQLLKLKGDALQVGGAPDPEVEQEYQLAIDLARQQKSRSLELRATTSLCRLWQKQGKVTSAHQRLLGIYGWFTEGFDTHDLVEAKALLDELKTANRS